MSITKFVFWKLVYILCFFIPGIMDYGTESAPKNWMTTKELDAAHIVYG